VGAPTRLLVLALIGSVPSCLVSIGDADSNDAGAGGTGASAATGGGAPGGAGGSDSGAGGWPQGGAGGGGVSGSGAGGVSGAGAGGVSGSGAGGGSGSGAIDGGAGLGGAGAGGVAGQDAGGGGADAASDGYVSEVLKDAPLLYWRLGDAFGTVAVDSSGNGHHGTIYGNVGFGETGAIAGNAAMKFGAGRIEGPSTFDFVDTAAFSVEFWVIAIGAQDPYARIVSKDALVGNKRQGWNVNFEEEYKIQLTRWRDGLGNFAGALFTAKPTYTHVVASYDGVQLRVYLDGVQKTALTGSLLLVDTDKPLTLGSQTEWANPFVGVVDELAIYDVALAPARIAAHYAAAAP
jgi:hypothetical protein